MIYAYTDFGQHDLYVGQLKAVMSRHAPNVPQIDLLHDAPAFDVLSSAHLLHALVSQLPTMAGDVFLTVVDPGVGSDRRAVVMQADGLWFVGPDNGLLSIVCQRARISRVWEIVWRPERLSASFHGRDLFAVVAARLADGACDDEMLREIDALDIMYAPGDSASVIYIDHYGNVMTGVRGVSVSRDVRVWAKGQTLEYARTFCEAPASAPFWYVNSLGLLEIAVNGKSAAHQLGLRLGDQVEFIDHAHPQANGGHLHE